MDDYPHQESLMSTFVVAKVGVSWMPDLYLEAHLAYVLSLEKRSIKDVGILCILVDGEPEFNAILTALLYLRRCG